MPTSSTPSRASGSVLGRKNFLLLGAGVGVLVVGYVLLTYGHPSFAAAVLVLGYCVLVPLGLAL